MKLRLTLLALLILQGCTATCPNGYKLSGILCFKDEEAIDRARQEHLELLNTKAFEDNERRREEESRIREYQAQSAKRQAQLEADLIERKKKAQEEAEKRKKDEENQRLKYKLQEEAAERKRRQELETCLSRGSVGMCVAIEDRPMVNVCRTGNDIHDLALAFDVQSYGYCYKRNNNAINVQLTIRNNNTSTIRDVSVNCVQLAESGTVLRSNTNTIYKNFHPNNQIRFDFNLARAQQFGSLRCTIENWAK